MELDYTDCPYSYDTGAIVDFIGYGVGCIITIDNCVLENCGVCDILNTTLLTKEK